ncbi:hypothetical protein CDD83_3547 [Cordyceps sp. RAO-2017]|nr:hypothetical protein CDD83_3547 [Cordyceps sp. RAO-2017]
MKTEVLAVAVALFAGAVASPHNMNVNGMSQLGSMTAAQFGAMSEHEAQAACFLCPPCNKKRDIQEVQAPQKTETDQASTCFFCCKLRPPPEPPCKGCDCPNPPSSCNKPPPCEGCDCPNPPSYCFQPPPCEGCDCPNPPPFCFHPPPCEGCDCPNPPSYCSAPPPCRGCDCPNPPSWCKPDSDYD